MTLSFEIRKTLIFPVMNTIVRCKRASVITPVVGFFPESESSFRTGRVGESVAGRGVVKSCGPASLLQLELLKAVCTGHYSWPFTPLRTLSVEPANNNNNKTPKRIQANWPTIQTAPQLSTLFWISTITGLHVLIHLPFGLLHYSHTLCFLTLQSSVHLGPFLSFLPYFRHCSPGLCILHLFLAIMWSLSWIMVLLFSWMNSSSHVAWPSGPYSDPQHGAGWKKDSWRVQ